MIKDRSRNLRTDDHSGSVKQILPCSIVALFIIFTCLPPLPPSGESLSSSRLSLLRRSSTPPPSPRVSVLFGHPFSGSALLTPYNRGRLSSEPCCSTLAPPLPDSLSDASSDEAPRRRSAPEGLSGIPEVVVHPPEEEEESFRRENLQEEPPGKDRHASASASALTSSSLDHNLILGSGVGCDPLSSSRTQKPNPVAAHASMTS